MRCTCSGIRIDKCNCRILGTRYQCDPAGDLTWSTHSKDYPLTELNTTNRTHNHKKCNFWLSIIERLYEKCAAYNLRYCPIAGFTKHDNYIGNMLKDFVILACFLVANFVVFITIFIKMGVHLYFAVMTSAQWLGRSFTRKAALESPVILTVSTPQRNDCPPKAPNLSTVDGH